MTTNDKDKLSQIFIETGYITESQLNLALKIQERDKIGRLGTILIQLGYITLDQLMQCFDRQNKKK